MGGCVVVGYTWVWCVDVYTRKVQRCKLVSLVYMRIVHHMPMCQCSTSTGTVPIQL